jgi:hypothetical protein
MTWKAFEQNEGNSSVRDDGSVSGGITGAFIEEELRAAGLTNNANDKNGKMVMTDCGWDNIFKNKQVCEGPDVVVLPIIIKDGDVKNGGGGKTDRLPDVGPPKDKHEEKPWIDCGWGRLIDYMQREKHEKLGRVVLSQSLGGKLGVKAAEELE